MPKIDLSVNKVTPLSKTIALIIFILFPFIGFRLGMKYQKSLDIIELNTPEEKLSDKNTDKENKGDAPDPGYMKEMIVVDSPKPYEVITNPITIKGKARGTWFFEGSFPITLYCGINNKIAEGFATAQDEWMTEDFVDFTATLTFNDMCDTTGILELKKDNPSGLTELDDKVLIPVKINR